MQLRRECLRQLAVLCAGTMAVVSANAADGPGKVDKDAPKKFTTTKSGLKYRIRRKSKGEKPKPKSRVTVHYRGWLPDKGDKVFDSSYKRKKPITFALNRVIKGWQEGMQLIGEGGMIELEIPPELGYGKRGAGTVIPPDATLRFLVELIKVEAP